MNRTIGRYGRVLRRHKIKGLGCEVAKVWLP